MNVRALRDACLSISSFLLIRSYVYVRVCASHFCASALHFYCCLHDATTNVSKWAGSTLVLLLFFKQLQHICICGSLSFVFLYILPSRLCCLGCACILCRAHKFIQSGIVCWFCFVDFSTNKNREFHGYCVNVMHSFVCCFHCCYWFAWCRPLGPTAQCSFVIKTNSIFMNLNKMLQMIFPCNVPRIPSQTCTSKSMKIPTLSYE